MKHQYEDYMEWIDEKRAELAWAGAVKLRVPNRGSRFYEIPQYQIDDAKMLSASLLANKATLERHKEVVHYELPTREQKKAGMDYTDPSLAYSTCSCAFVNHYIAGDGYPSISVGKNTFPCPSLLDVTNQLDEVMG